MPQTRTSKDLGLIIKFLINSTEKLLFKKEKVGNFNSSPTFEITFLTTGKLALFLLFKQ